MQLLPSDIKMLTLILVNIFLFGKIDADRPQLEPIKKNVTVVAGDTAVLPCSVTNLGVFKVVWERMNPKRKTLTLDTRRIISDDRISVERPHKHEWNLHIREVRTTDSGLYECQINTEPVQLREMKLIVQVPSKIIDNLSTETAIKVTEGDTVELVCNVTGLPIPTVTWYRVPKGLKLLGDNEKKQIGREGEVLVIYNVSRFCDDEYECVAFNGVADADSRTIRVSVQFPPEVQTQNPTLGQYLGLNTILDCKVTSNPNLETKWRFKGNTIVKKTKKYSTEIYIEGANVISITLTIHNLQKEDYGLYECVSTNHLGTDSDETLLTETVTTTASTTTTIAPMRRKLPHTTRRYDRINSHAIPWNGNPENSGNPYEKVIPENNPDDENANGYGNGHVNIGGHTGQSRSGDRGNGASGLRKHHDSSMFVLFTMVIIFVVNRLVLSR